MRRVGVRVQDARRRLEKDPHLKGRVDMTWGAKVDVLAGRPHAFQVILAKRALSIDSGTHNDAAALPGSPEP